jgi:lysophospholipase L1-like esterase
MKYPAIIATLFSATCLLNAEIPIKPGDKVAFLGDSITQQGAGSPGGYVQLVGSGLAANGVNIEIVGAGISGHKSNQMLERLGRDVLGKKPQWMTLSCGVNDVWHGKNGVPLEDYRKNITAIVDQAQAAGIKVMILTSTMIRENQENPENQTLAGYNAFLRSLAAEKKCLLADLNAEMQAAIAEAAKTRPAPPKGNYMTTDGVHMAAAGNQMMALGVLKGFGLSEAELAKAKDAWLDVPNTSTLAARMGLTQRQMQQLEKVAKARNISVDELINGEFTKLVNSLMESGSR